MGPTVISKPGDHLAIAGYVQDLMESVKSDQQVAVRDATVTTTVLYPSGKSENFKNITKDEGYYSRSWSNESEKLLLNGELKEGEGKIIVKVSKENKESSELIKTFVVRSERKGVK